MFNGLAVHMIMLWIPNISDTFCVADVVYRLCITSAFYQMGRNSLPKYCFMLNGFKWALFYFLPIKPIYLIFMMEVVMKNRLSNIHGIQIYYSVPMSLCSSNQSVLNISSICRLEVVKILIAV